jgi:hypothetical protein
VRYAASIEIELPADVIERSPTFWDGWRAWVGADVDLSTDRVRNRIEAVTFLYEVRGALDALGIHNARSLVVDGVVVFEDHEGRPNDLPDLMFALADHTLVLSDACRHVRLTVEHEEAGLNFEVEARIALEHDRDEPGARISVLGRVLDLGPRPLESTEAYRTRIERYISTPKHWAAVKVQFATFVSRLEQALGAVLPGASMKTTERALELEATWAEGTDRFVAPRRAGPAAVSTTTRTAPLRTPSIGGPRGERVPETPWPARNQRLSLEDRIAAAVTAPPPSAMRLREIEALEARLLNELAVCERDSLDAVPTGVANGLDELNALIHTHNQVGAAERSPPGVSETGDTPGPGASTATLPLVSIDDLRRIAAAIRAAPAAANRPR